MLSHQRLLHLHLLRHLFKFLEGLLELFAGRRVLCASRNKLHSVQLGLVVQVVK